ncbi:hypothetical protein HMPREF0043_02016 [Actinobaculum sp. oral taxon 183 str. F0552]|nr:hypothetical protein HMPREF0043_02016 [Actinobaculum sp. oral taxon 183 str. F0552]
MRAATQQSSGFPPELAHFEGKDVEFHVIYRTGDPLGPPVA